MAKIKKMGEGIVVKDAPDHRTTIDGVMAKGKRTTTNGKTLLILSFSTVQKVCNLTVSPSLRGYTDLCNLVLISISTLTERVGLFTQLLTVLNVGIWPDHFQSSASPEITFTCDLLPCDCGTGRTVFILSCCLLSSCISFRVSL